MITKEEFNQRRATYLAAPVEERSKAHQEFYSWLAKGIGFTERMLTSRISKDEILRSTDEHFNDITLKYWDDLHCLIHPIHLPWSLSDSVCVAKAVARQIREAA